MRITHGACGKSWQGGERSGHCSGCHRTFYGLTTFDRHRKGGECRYPGDLPGPWWVDDDGQWHYGERLTEEQKRERGWVK